MTTQSSVVTLLNAVTATTTSNSIRVGQCSKLSLQVTAASITSGNGVFSVTVSNDGTNWVTYNRLTTNSTNTTANGDIRVASLALSANGSNLLFFPSDDVFEYLKVTVTRTTDGAYSAALFMQQDG